MSLVNEAPAEFELTASAAVSTARLLGLSSFRVWRTRPPSLISSMKPQYKIFTHHKHTPTSTHDNERNENHYPKQHHPLNQRPNHHATPAEIDDDEMSTHARSADDYSALTNQLEHDEPELQTTDETPPTVSTNAKNEPTHKSAHPSTHPT